MFLLALKAIFVKHYIAVYSSLFVFEICISKNEALFSNKIYEH